MTGNKRIQIGFQINPRVGRGETFDPWEYVALAERADRMGIDFLAVPDIVSRYVPRFDALTYIMALAMRTQRIRIGTDVLATPLRSPIELARRAATVDILSNGRLDLGVGIGWLPKEFEDVGIPIKERGARTDEIIQILKRLWTEDEVTFEGRFYQFRNVVMEPKPLQKPHIPIWIGASAEAGLRRTGRYGDGWAGQLESRYNQLDARDQREGPLPPTDAGEAIEKIRSYAREAGRDPNQIQFSVILRCHFNDDPAKAEAAGLEFWSSQLNQIEGGRPWEYKKKLGVFGPAEWFVERAKQLQAAGVHRVVIYPETRDIGKQLDEIEQKILPNL